MPPGDRHVLKDAGIIIKIGTDADIDLSDRIRSVTVTGPVDLQDLSAMGDKGRVRMPGFEDSSVEIEWVQDYAVGKVDATLWDVRSRQEDEDVLLRLFPFKALAHPDTDNPEYIAKYKLSDYTPIGGTAGDAHLAPSTFQLSDSGGLVRDNNP